MLFCFLDGKEKKEIGAICFEVRIPWKKAKVVENVVRHLATIRFSLELFLARYIQEKLFDANRFGFEKGGAL